MGNGVPDSRERRAVRPRHRPLIPVLVGVALGIALDRTLQPPVLLWLALALVVAAGSVWGIRRGLRAWGNWTLALLLLVPFAGVYHAARARHKPRWHLKNLALRGDVSYYVRGEVAGEPEVYYRHSAFDPGTKQPQPYWLVRVDLEALSGDHREWRKAAGGMAVFVGEGRPALNVGDEVEFFARPRANRRPSNPGERNRALAYERRGSYATASVHSPDAFTVLSRASWHSSARAAVARLRSYVQRRMEEHLPLAEPGSRFVLVSALLFGRRNALTPEQDALLKESDTLHFLAISGLHVGLFCLFIECVFALLGLPVRFRTVLTIALIWLYVLFTGVHVPALRAGLMLTFLLAAPVLGRQRDSLSAFAGAALVILLLSPGQLFAPGFQFTFMAVWAMISIYPQLAQMLWPWEDLLARLHAPEERSLWTDVWTWARSYLLLSCVVWVATAPVRVYHFNSRCILAPLLNLLVWPLVLLLLLTCFALVVSILLGGIGLGAIAWLAQFLSGDIETLLRAAARLPGFGIYLPSPPVWWIGLFYVAVAAWVMRGRLWGGRSLFLVAALLLGGTYVGNDAICRAQRRFSLTVADVGLGQAALLCVPDGQAVLFDAGSSGRSSAETVAEMLWHSRIRRINGIVISHLDSDHCNFAPFLARRFDVDQVIVPVSGELAASSSRL
ncbi:MAG: ComEC/Rec2 family competence protein, partial [Planctomycetota bacterium]